MRLAVVVVYLVSEEYEWLLDLHLSKIAEHTTSAHHVYGSAVRLASGARERLLREPRVKLYDLPQTDLRGAEEHSLHLERLVELALDDGASHVVFLHVDSFPVRDGWDVDLADRLGPDCPFVTTPRINSACLMFGREFHVRHRPALLVPEARRDEEFRRYVREMSPNDHSGIGYGFAAWRAGLQWHELPETSDPSRGEGASIHGDLVFHLGGANRLASPRQAPPRVMSFIGSDRVERLLSIQRRVLPESLRNVVRRWLGGAQHAVDESRLSREREAMIRFRSELERNPDEAIRRLRGRSS